MPANQATGIDWSEIKQRIIAGETYRAISRGLAEQGIKLSHVAISKRARRHGWKPTPETKFLETRTAKRIAEPKTAGDHNLIKQGKRTAESLKAICDYVKDGLSPPVAAVKAGMSAQTWYDWIKDDPEIENIVNDASLENVATAETALQAAIERGDIQAIKMGLRHPAVRDRYEDVNAAKGGGLTVVFNMSDPKQIEPPTITVNKDE